MSKIIKIIDERETQKEMKIIIIIKKKQNKGDGSHSERVRNKWFCWAFKLGFL